MTVLIKQRSRSFFRKVKPYVAMSMLQFGFAGMYVIKQAVLKDGMNHFVLVVYCNVVAFVAITPFALWFERAKRPKMTTVIFLTILAIVVIEVETLNMRRRGGQLKVTGTLLTVGGALLLILYKGPILDFPWFSSGAKRQAESLGQSSNGGDRSSFMWLKGTLMLIGSSIRWSGFLILQSNTLESYPAELTITAWVCFMGVIGWDMRIFTGVICTRVFCTIMIALMSSIFL